MVTKAITCAVTKKPTWSPYVFLSLASCIGGIEPGTSGGSGPGRPPSPGGGVAQPPGESSTPTRPPGATLTDPPPPPPRERPSPPEIGTTRFARLSHRQWANTVRDLLRLPETPGYERKFTTDAVRTFANDGETLVVSDGLWADYQTAAEAVAQKVAQDPTARQRLLPPGIPPAGKERALAFIEHLGRRGYRRPLNQEEVMAYTALFDKGPTLVPGAEAFAGGAQLVLEAMLQSPHLLYRTELTSGAGRVRLSDYEVASKLSYSLTGTMPDDDLFAAAARKGLVSHEQVSAQAERLLNKGAEPAFTFHEELLGLRSLAGEIDKDLSRYPEFQPEWRDSITREATTFLQEVFTAGRGLTELLTAPFTFVDANLASLYGVKAPVGDGFAKIDLDPKQRAGLLTQTAFLARYGSTESDPILRGAYINHTLLCLDLEPPPGVTEEVPDPPASAKTNRERVTAVTSAAQCAACHAAFINPAGFASRTTMPSAGSGRWRVVSQSTPPTPTASPPGSRASRMPSNLAGCWPRAPRHTTVMPATGSPTCRGAYRNPRTSRS